MERDVHLLRAAAIVAVLWLFTPGLVHAQRGAAGVAKEQRALERPRRWAILIGVNKYEDEQGIGSLKYCAADMKLLAEVLTGPNGGFGRKNVLLMTADADNPLHRPTYSNMVTMIPRWLADVGPNDDVVVAFAGHGITEDGECYLLPNTAKRGALRLTSVSVPQVREWLEGCRAKRKVLILDACHSGAGRAVNEMADEWKRELESGHGFLRLASCDTKQKSNEDPSLGHGVFTYYLAKALQGEADFDGDGRVGVGEAYRFVSREVRGWAREHGLKQDPLMSGRIVGGQLTVCYAPTRRKRTAPQPTAEQTAALHLTIEPGDTEVFIDGDPVEMRRRGRIVFTKVAPGRHMLEVRKDGHVHLERVLDVPATGMECRVKLSRILQHVTVYTKGGGGLPGVLLSKAGDKITFLYRGKHSMTYGKGQYEKVEYGKEEPEGESTFVTVGRAATPTPLAKQVHVPQPAPIPQPAPAPVVPAGGKSFTNPVDGSEMVYVQAGTFKMGSNDIDEAKPIHGVSVGSFYIGKYEVTNRQFSKFLEANPQWRKDRIDSKWHDGKYLKHWTGNTCPADKVDHPVVYVSWFAAKAYCEWAGGRLPTEAEWEYACRAGSTTKYCFGDSDRQLGDYAWYGNNSGGSTHPVGQKKASKWGIHDMHGNAWEWCSSKYQPYPCKADDGREDMNDTGSRRVLRNGGWHASDECCRSARRGSSSAAGCCDGYGFRVASFARAPNEDPSAPTQPAPAKPSGRAWTNPTDGSEMVLCPAGSFKMGEGSKAHNVSVGSFYIGTREVTNRQFEKFVDANPHWSKGRIDSEYHDGDYLKHWKANTYPSDKVDHPVVYVSWFAAKAYCEWAGGRLPTEAEWEYACRAGSTTKYCFGDDDRELGAYAWYRSTNSDKDTKPVGKKKANQWGIHDMHGNVWEWCSSLSKPYPYKANDGLEDMNDTGSDRVMRGGSWFYGGTYCRSAFRGVSRPAYCRNRSGFRVCLSARPPR